MASNNVIKISYWQQLARQIGLLLDTKGTQMGGIQIIHLRLTNFRIHLLQVSNTVEHKK